MPKARSLTNSFLSYSCVVAVSVKIGMLSATCSTSPHLTLYAHPGSYGKRVNTDRLTGTFPESGLAMA